MVCLVVEELKGCELVRNLFVRESGNYKTTYSNDMKMFGTTGAKIKGTPYRYCRTFTTTLCNLIIG